VDLPLLESVAHNVSWDALVLSMYNLLNNYTFIFLNIPSRLILLKNVLQSIHAYMFSALPVPQIIIKSIRSL